MTTNKEHRFTTVSARVEPSNIISKFSSVSALALLLGMSFQAQAAAQLEEIVVTAQKREQSLQEVPLSVTAFTGNMVRELGLSRPQELANQIPGVVMKSPNGDNSPIFTIRGIGLTDFSVSNNSATSVYVDQVVKPYYPMINFALFDLERVEVLKGPQGTLYGRNNTGGAIKFVTRKPSAETDAFMRLDYGRFDTFEFEGAVGGALAEDLNARLAVYTRQRSKGYQFNNLTGERNGETDRLAGRLGLAWQASDTFDINLTVQAGRSRSDVPLFKLAPPFDANAGSPVVCAAALQGIRARDGSCIDLFGQFDPDPDIDHIQAGNVQGSGLEEDAWGVVLDMNWDLSGAILTSVTGYDSHERLEYQDFDASPLIVADNSFTQDIESFSQELRIASDGSSSFHWIAGVFYSKDTLDNLQRLQADNFFGFPGGHINIDWRMETESYAGFGQIEYPIAKEWELIGGLRYTYEKRSFDGGTTPMLIPILPVVQVSNDTDAKDLSGKVGVNYKPSEDLMVYLSASKGFKSGGFNGAFATNPVTYTPYGPEEIFAYELGFKSTLADGRLQLNAAAYYYDWQDFQATVTSTDPVTNLPVQLLTNAGNARVIGIEGDLLWQASEFVSVGLSAAWNDGKITSGELDGRRLANNPEFSANGMLRFELPVDELGGSVFAQSDFNYRTDYDTRIVSATTRPLVTQEAFWLVNARAGFRTENDRIEVSAWVKNIFDKRYLIEVFDQGTINTLDLYAEPRTYGVSLTYRFN